MVVVALIECQCWSRRSCNVMLERTAPTFAWFHPVFDHTYVSRIWPQMDPKYHNGQPCMTDMTRRSAEHTRVCVTRLLLFYLKDCENLSSWLSSEDVHMARGPWPVSKYAIACMKLEKATGSWFIGLGIFPILFFDFRAFVRIYSCFCGLLLIVQHSWDRLLTYSSNVIWAQGAFRSALCSKSFSNSYPKIVPLSTVEL